MPDPKPLRRHTAAQRILRQHGQQGYELTDGRLRVRNVFTLHGKTYSEWETIEKRELWRWLGY
jgi:hypothetical protein